MVYSKCDDDLYAERIGPVKERLVRAVLRINEHKLTRRIEMELWWEMLQKQVCLLAKLADIPALMRSFTDNLMLKFLNEKLLQTSNPNVMMNDGASLSRMTPNLARCMLAMLSNVTSSAKRRLDCKLQTAVNQAAAEKLLCIPRMIAESLLLASTPDTPLFFNSREEYVSLTVARVSKSSNNISVLVAEAGPATTFISIRDEDDGLDDSILDTIVETFFDTNPIFSAILRRIPLGNILLIVHVRNSTTNERLLPAHVVVEVNGTRLPSHSFSGLPQFWTSSAVGADLGDNAPFPASQHPMASNNSLLADRASKSGSHGEQSHSSQVIGIWRAALDQLSSFLSAPKFFIRHEEHNNAAHVDDVAASPHAGSLSSLMESGLIKLSSVPMSRGPWQIAATINDLRWHAPIVALLTIALCSGVFCEASRRGWKKRRCAHRLQNPVPMSSEWTQTTCRQANLADYLHVQCRSVMPSYYSKDRHGPKVVGILSAGN
ncbi:hypothetical protein CBR_g40668 [Chara braunii]|uniref:Uncharacterized protein n=1 Tax=Chara braunii TaxID=69332 RepID=A0A388LU62_CHABU|nr:hypothetical protein CBR_g40668 [Chara braunii]|eukprot:GBG85857.1 hypothetical protein CBR_g40668 [Chara braunii]